MNVNISDNVARFDVPTVVTEVIGSDWMQIERRKYLNLATGVMLAFWLFEGAHRCDIYLGSNNWTTCAEYADNFANLVGYRWSE